MDETRAEKKRGRALPSSVERPPHASDNAEAECRGGKDERCHKYYHHNKESKNDLSTQTESKNRKPKYGATEAAMAFHVLHRWKG